MVAKEGALSLYATLKEKGLPKDLLPPVAEEIKGLLAKDNVPTLSSATIPNVAEGTGRQAVVESVEFVADFPRTPVRRVQKWKLREGGRSACAQ